MPSNTNNNITERRKPGGQVDELDEFEALLAEEDAPATHSEQEDDFDSLLNSVSGSSAPATADHMKLLMEMQVVVNALMSSTSTPSSVLLKTAYGAMMKLKASLPDKEKAQANNLSSVSASRLRVAPSRMRPPGGARSKIRGSRAFGLSRSVSRFGRPSRVRPSFTSRQKPQ